MRLNSAIIRNVLMPALVAAFGVAGYLVYSGLYYHAGFPLDDAWIHQTYARNLASLGEWSFIPGEPSGGSTSPLWTVLLLPGALSGLPVLWPAMLGWISLTMIGVCARSIVRHLVPTSQAGLVPLAVLVGLEWHLVWSAVSGMETLLTAAVILIVLWGLITARLGPVWLGLLTGIATWLRPDGITLMAPVILYILFSRRAGREKLSQLLQSVLVFVCLFLPYLLFNARFAGTIWPTTFFAKQAEYAIELQAPFISRVLEQAMLPLVGAGMILLPGAAYLVFRAIKTHNIAVIAACLWAGGYALMFAVRLPVSYQHGRYLIPMMPVYFSLGMAGLFSWVRPGSQNLLTRLLSKVGVVSFVVVTVMFLILGGRAFGRDVAFIESEMVETALWISENTPADALVAAHDIGAVGYWGQRRMVDLAGLISPEVIPFIRDEGQLAEYLDSVQADYLVSFPGWYPNLVEMRQEVYVSGGRYAREQGYENMTVYRWRALP